MAEPALQAFTRCLIAILFLVACGPVTPTQEVIPTTTPTLTATILPSATPSLTPSPTPTITQSPTPTLTPTPLFLALPGTPLPGELAPIWFGNAEQVSALAEFNQDNIVDLHWSPDGDTLLIAGVGKISRYRVDSRTLLDSSTSQNMLVGFDINPQNTWLVAGFRTGSEGAGFTGGLEFWSMPDLRSRGMLYQENRALSSLETTSDGEQLAVSFTDREMDSHEVVIWDTLTWEISSTIKTDQILNIAYSDDGALLATTPDRYAVKIWRTRDGRKLHTIYTSFTGAVNCLVFSPDGQKLATGHYDGLIRVWDTATAALLQSYESGSVVTSLDFNQEASILVSGGGFQDNALRLWDSETGLLLRVLEGHTHSVDRLAFSPDGQMIASGSYDGTVRLWGIRP